jgi:multiple sugar transport system substrate-binding protein
MKMKRFLTATSILVVAVMLLSACGTTATPQVIKEQVTSVVVVTATPAPTQPPAAGAKVILRVGTGDSGEGLTPHQTIISNFEAANPDILVQLEAVAGNDYYTRLLTQIAAGDAPDIMQIGDDAVPMFVSKGALVPLDDFIKGQYPLDTGIYLPGLLNPGTWEGKQYLLPKDFSPLAVYYNKRIFDQYGVAYPKDGWTWDDMLKTAQDLTKDENADGKPEMWGVQSTANWTTGFEYWVAAAGGRLISEDGKKYVGYMDSAETISAVQFFADLYNKYKVAPPPADYNLWAGGNSEFENGKAAMRLFGRWPEAGLKKNPNIDLGLVGVPAGKVRADVLFWGGFGISTTAKHPEEAWRFLRYYAGTEGSQVWKDWALPPVAAVAEQAGLTKDPIEGVWISELNYLAPRAYVFTPYWGETADPALNKALQTVLIDPKADVAATMQKAAQDAQAALDEKLK